MKDHIVEFVNWFEKKGLYPDFKTITAGVNETTCTVDGKQYLMFSSNNYLGLTQHPAVKAAGKAAIDKYGMGPGGSRVISGNIDVIEELEQRIAYLTGTEDCLTFPTGYMANVGVIKALMDPMFDNKPFSADESVIFSDEYNHGSIVDGVRLSKARRVIFKHDDIDDLKKKIKENNLPNKLIITEGVFSLDGRIIDLPAYIAVAKESKARLMIDDAHGIGILGKRGGGVVDLYDCGDQVDVVMGCMDKAFGGTGGYLCGKKSMIKFLRIACRSSLLSSALPSGMAGAMIESVNQIEMGQSLRQQLFEKAGYLRGGLRELGFNIVGPDNLPALALYVGEEIKGIKFAERLWEEGIYCPIVRWPATPLNESRFRIIVMVDHTIEQMDTLIAACQKIGKELRVIR